MNFKYIKLFTTHLGANQDQYYYNIKQLDLILTGLAF